MTRKLQTCHPCIPKYVSSNIIISIKYNFNIYVHIAVMNEGTCLEVVPDLCAY